jgi:hypothetical protein
MARSFYRLYLYSIYIFLLIFLAIDTGQFLNKLLAFTPFRISYSQPPTHEEFVQSVVLTIIAWLIAGVLAALHGWLIRRDARQDPAVANSLIRSLFLNITEAVGVTLAVAVGGFSLFNQATRDGVIPIAASIVVPTLILVGLLEWEREQAQATSGLALFFQRLQFYRVQFDLLTFLSIGWIFAFRPLVDGLLFHGQITLDACKSSFGSESYFSPTYCPTYNNYYLLASILWFLLFWLGYEWLSRKDDSRIMRFIFHGLGLASGISLILASLHKGVELLLLPLFKIPGAKLQDILGPSASYDFVSPLVLGILVTGVYHFWLHRAAKRGLIHTESKCSLEITIAALVAAQFFWIGCGMGIFHTLQVLTHTSNPDFGPPWLNTDAHAWLLTIAFIIAGLAYIPLDILLRRRNAKDPATASAALRGLTLAFFGSGVVIWVIGSIGSLYLWITAALAAPVDNWQQTIHIALAMCITGIVLMGIYLWPVLRGKHAVQQAAPLPAIP